MNYKKVTQDYLKRNPYPNGLDELKGFAYYIGAKLKKEIINEYVQKNILDK